MAQSTLFRSEEMSLIQLYMPAELAQPTVAELGDIGVVEFRDLNGDLSAFQRAYVNEIRRLDEMDRRLRFLWTQTEKAGLVVKPAVAGPALRARKQQEIDELDHRLAEAEGRVLQMNQSQDVLNKRFLELTEMRHVLRESAAFFHEAESREMDAARGGPVDDRPLLTDDVEAGEAIDRAGNRNVGIGFVAGVIERRKMLPFERILWRSLRGNLYMNSAEIDDVIIDPATDEEVQKNVFIIFAHGRELLAKIRKISESLGATLYPIDPSPEKRREDTLEVVARLEDLNNVLANTNTTRRSELAKLADTLDAWGVIIKKEKAIYYTLNMFNIDGSRKTLIGEGWCPTAALPQVQLALKTAQERAGSVVSTIMTDLRTTKEPPTYHRTNKFTAGFQELIDSYGVARYREVNPGLFTVISFPFLFAVMFGDFGHAILVTASALYMVFKERSLAASTRDNEILRMIFAGRYLILLMGIFSLFTGLIYNDMFSRMMSIFASGWALDDDPVVPGGKVGRQTGVYPFGVDWVWMFAEEKLLFTNSYKMKMSIVFGVVHMTFGIVLSLVNHLHFRNMMNVFCQFIPEIIFMESIFGYLVICIIYKWCTDWYARGADGRLLRNSPPSLLNMLIFMFLKPGNTDDGLLYAGQGTVQVILLLLAFICVPWMLCVKPFLIRRHHQRIVSEGYATLPVSNATAPSEGAQSTHTPGQTTSPADHSAETEHFDFGEVVIHQVIHTIEFCLGCISNTASYLRLWALSLAHAQLSEVLWTMTLGWAFEKSGVTQVIMLVVFFAFFMCCTIGILLLMEGLSAFLHALRLHWVEFTNKFYAGSGRKFTPFSFAHVLEAPAE
ncbi:H(+)-transporting V0 sector ATPase subunit a [Sorochytrium milnesiophthora]